MKKNNLLKSLFITLSFISMNPLPIYAGGGKSFGLFAGGAVAGGLIGSAIAKRNNRRYEQPTVIQERVIERPVYIQQSHAPTQQPGVPVHTTAQSQQKAQQLENRLYEQDERIRKLEQELRRAHREERRRKPEAKVSTDEKTKLQDKVFDGFDPSVEGLN